MPCRAASRALTGCPCFPAMDGCGRRTRKPPAGALSKEVRCSKTQTQQYKKAFSASRNFPAYRQAADTMHIRPPRLALRRVLPIHALSVYMSAPSCALCRPCLVSDTDYTACAWRSGICRIPSPHVSDVYLEPSVYPPATRRIQVRAAPDTHPPHSRCPHHASPFLRGCLFARPALSPRASLRFVYTLRV